MINPNTWEIAEWFIYDDLSFEIIIHYNDAKEKTTKYNGKISETEFNTTTELIEKIKEEDAKIIALDATTWEIIEYHNAKKVWFRAASYIYGLKSFENLAIILQNLIHDKIYCHNLQLKAFMV